jgi:uncharacterized protein
MWRETTVHERNLRIFQEELDDWLPESILDFHVHVFGRGVVPEGQTLSCAGHAIESYDLADLAGDLAAVYPGRRTSAVCFGVPEPKYDQRRNDRYLAEACDGRRFFAVRLFDPLHDEPAALRADLAGGRFVGIKPYPDYARPDAPAQAEIADMLPDWAMDIVDELGLLVVLHLPRPGRLADPLNQRQLRRLCEHWPRAAIVLAHIGRTYFLRCVLGHLQAVADLPNLYFDTAMVNHWEVLEHLFRHAAAGRVVYGTDIPIALAGGKSVEINHQYTYVTPVPWDLSIHDPRGKIVFTSFLYEQLRAIRTATQRLGLGAEFLRAVFWENGQHVLKKPEGAIAARKA